VDRPCGIHAYKVALGRMAASTISDFGRLAFGGSY
jgi:hypothetical protein